MTYLQAWVSAAAIALAGCAAPDVSRGTAPAPGASPQASMGHELDAQLRQCSRQHGFDPGAARDAPQNALAPGELPWRQCAYDAIRAHGRSDPALAPRYEQLIAEDITMTNSIQQGTMTRAQRRARLETLIEQIRAIED